MIALVQNVSLDDDAVLESIRVKEPSDLMMMTLTGTQQALLLGLWLVLLSCMSLSSLFSMLRCVKNWGKNRIFTSIIIVMIGCSVACRICSLSLLTYF